MYFVSSLNRIIIKFVKTEFTNRKLQKLNRKPRDKSFESLSSYVRPITFQAIGLLGLIDSILEVHYF